MGASPVRVGIAFRGACVVEPVVMDHCWREMRRAIR